MPIFRYKILPSFIHRGSSAVLGVGVGIVFEGSTAAYIGAGLFIVLGVGIFIWNWIRPVDDKYVPSIAEAIRNSNVVWGFWHTGNRARESLYYRTVNRILALEPNADSEAFKHVLTEVSGRPTTASEILAQLKLLKEEALSKDIELKWHNEITSLSFMICDPSAKVEGDLTTFSNKAFVVAQVLDRNLNIEEWSFYKKTKVGDKYAFDAYEKWFREVWHDRSKAVG